MVGKAKRIASKMKPLINVIIGNSDIVFMNSLKTDRSFFWSSLRVNWPLSFAQRHTNLLAFRFGKLQGNLTVNQRICQWRKLRECLNLSFLSPVRTEAKQMESIASTTFCTPVRGYLEIKCLYFRRFAFCLDNESRWSFRWERAAVTATRTF